MVILSYDVVSCFVHIVKSFIIDFVVFSKSTQRHTHTHKYKKRANAHSYTSTFTDVPA
jgi:hypothetical protein